MNRFDYFVDPDISVAHTLPGKFYTDTIAFDYLKETAFRNAWHLACRSSDLKTPGTCFPFVLLPGFLDEPLVITRDHKDKIHCLSNVCTHRGALVVEGYCVEKVLRCRYHGRRFELDGKFRSMPEFEQCKNFPTPSDNLTTLSIDNWNEFVFVSLDERTSLKSQMNFVEEITGFMPISEFQFDARLSRDYAVHANWALYCENYLEGFHIPYVHPDLNSQIDFNQYRTTCHEFGVLQTAIADKGELTFQLPENHADFGKNIAAYYFWIFPNLMLNFYPWGLSINIVKPVSTSLTKVSFIPYVWKPELLGSGAGGAIDRVEREDEAIVESVQMGTKSNFYGSGRYSPTQEIGTHHFHRMLVKALS